MFAPMVVLVCNIMGTPKFNRIHRQAIALHSKTIGKFCNRFGIDSKKRQAWTHTARDKGQRLGFLA